MKNKLSFFISSQDARFFAPQPLGIFTEKITMSFHFYCSVYILVAYCVRITQGIMQTFLIRIRANHSVRVVVVFVLQLQ